MINRVHHYYCGILAFCILIAASSAQPCAGLIGHWTFDNQSVDDISGNNNHGTLVRGTFVPGVPALTGDALRTLNANNSYVQLTNAPSLNPTTGITLSAWVKDTATTVGNDPIIDKGATSHSAPFYQYHLGLASGFMFDLAINGTRRTITSNTSNNQWQHVVGTYNGSQMRIYVDGELRNSLNVNGTITTYNRNPRFGAFTNLPTVSTTASTDEVRMYSRGISADEVRFLFISPSGQPVIENTEVTACTGTQISLRVLHIGGEGFQWRRGSIPIDVTDNPTAITDHLVISEASGNHSGMYDVIVSNACGAAVAGPALITVCACLECSADFNQDGGIDGSDVSDFFDAWITGGCDGDTNQDGGVDGTDVSHFFDQWVNGGC